MYNNQDILNRTNLRWRKPKLDNTVVLWCREFPNVLIPTSDLIIGVVSPTREAEAHRSRRIKTQRGKTWREKTIRHKTRREKTPHDKARRSRTRLGKNWRGGFDETRIEERQLHMTRLDETRLDERSLNDIRERSLNDILYRSRGVKWCALLFRHTIKTTRHS